jgi:hypothetical protein
MEACSHQLWQIRLENAEKDVSQWGGLLLDVLITLSFVDEVRAKHDLKELFGSV